MSSGGDAFQANVAWLELAPPPTTSWFGHSYSRSAASTKIVDVASGAGVGSVGFWTKEWRDD